MFFIIDKILKKLIYAFLKWLQENRKYILHPDTTQDNIVINNAFTNTITFSADILCALLIILGSSQQIITYISLLTIDIYTFVDQCKKYMNDLPKLKSENCICEIKHRQNKYFKYYTPNLRYMVCTFFVFLILIVLSFIVAIKLYTLECIIGYYILVALILSYLMFIKGKLWLTETFSITDYVIR